MVGILFLLLILFYGEPLRGFVVPVRTYVEIYALVGIGWSTLSTLTLGSGSVGIDDSFLR
jgi:hypothetical protein